MRQEKLRVCIGSRFDWSSGKQLRIEIPLEGAIMRIIAIVVVVVVRL